jgi:four helix bundle protein
MTPRMLDHEKLEVYHLAREFTREVDALVRQLPPGRGDSVDQLRRASLSVPVNIAEGSGEFAPKEKARFYRIAKRSGTECGALLDYLVDIGHLTEQQTTPALNLIRRITGALVRLIQSTDPGSRPPAPSPARAREPASASAT